MPILRITLVVLLVTVGLIGSTIVVHLGWDEPFGRLTRDPTAVLKGPPYIGFLSQIGIFLWAGSAAICFLAAAVLNRASAGARVWSFFLSAGALSLLLGIDDAFLLHESVLPHFGLPEEAVVAGYAVLVGAWLVAYRQRLRARDALLLMTALVFFAISGLVDLVSPWQIGTLYEDSAKLAGLLFWLAYFAGAAMTALSDSR
ncbi:MAG: hypothetical protein HKN06_03610 [Gammaproteobacteria bacterium]|nr:hypothetical protein [Gammaproteobacteria bacterium]